MLGFLAVILLTSAISVLAIMELKSASSTTENFYDDPFTINSNVLEVRNNVINIRSTMKDVVLATNQAEIDGAVQKVDKLEAVTYQKIAVIEKRLVGKKEETALFKKEFIEWKSFRDKAIAMSREGRKDDAIAIIKGSGGNHTNLVLKTLDGVEKASNDKAILFKKDVISSSKKTVQMILVFLITAIILSITIVVFIVRGITVPLKTILQKVNEIAKGNFGEQIITNNKDELGSLSASINIMSQNLKSSTMELQIKNEEIERHAFQNYLTGLPNRHLFNKLLEEEMVKSKKINKPLAVVFIDLDHFRFINDIFGHVIGDYLLQSVGKRLSDNLITGEVVAHVSGDEFILLLPNGNLEYVTEKAYILLAALKQPFEYECNDILITPSIGISIYPTDTDDVEDAEMLVRCADIALSRTKQSGRNSFQFFNSTMRTNMQRRTILQRDLRKAIEQEEIILHYQSQINIVTNEPIGYEALVRWNHPILGLIPPNEFIPLAEESGQIVQMGEWIIRTACKQNAIWHEQGSTDLCIAVNISVLQFQQRNFLSIVKQALKDANLDPKYLEIELTESIAMYNKEQAISKLNKIRELGVKVAIDDFGTGYSSLNYLKNFPIDTLKIDKSFVDDISNKDNDGQIITTIIAMAKNLNFQVIAEGVETAEQLVFLKEHQCNVIQGYYFSKPLPVEELDKIMRVRQLR